MILDIGYWEGGLAYASYWSGVEARAGERTLCAGGAEVTLHDGVYAAHELKLQHIADICRW